MITSTVNAPRILRLVPPSQTLPCSVTNLTLLFLARELTYARPNSQSHSLSPMDNTRSLTISPREEPATPRPTARRLAILHQSLLASACATPRLPRASRAPTTARPIPTAPAHTAPTGCATAPHACRTPLAMPNVPRCVVIASRFSMRITTSYTHFVVARPW